MGKSKKFAEQICIVMNDNVSTNFKIVRFGNVFNSSESVFSIFMEKIEKGGPLTVTHPDAARDGADWVFVGGCVFVVDHLGLLQGKPKK